MGLIAWLEKYLLCEHLYFDAAISPVHFKTGLWRERIFCAQCKRVVQDRLFYRLDPFDLTRRIEKI